MKFTGLILMCASSCLALLLPAIGVIQFPRLDRAKGQVASPTYPVSTSVQNPQATVPNPVMSGNSNHLGWIPATQSMAASTGFGSQGGLLPGQSIQQGMPPFPSVPTLDASGSINPASKANSSKLGMGIWLLLAPVCLLGLALWTISPNPSGDKSKRMGIVK